MENHLPRDAPSAQYDCQHPGVTIPMSMSGTAGVDYVTNRGHMAGSTQFALIAFMVWMYL